MEYRVWQSSPVNNACRLAVIQGYERSFELAYGISLAAVFPKDARAPMDSAKVCSKRLVEFLKARDLRHVEYLPLTIVNHKGKVASTDYFIVNPVGLVDALDLAASKPVYNSIKKSMINRVARVVLDPRRLDPERKVFRLTGLFHPVLIEKGLADAMAAAGLVGPYFKELESFTG